MLEKGYIQVYTGDGKGKTTASLGLALRASGHGMKTVIIQFMKGRFDYGEVTALGKIPEISLYQFGRIDFVMKGQEQEIDYEEARKALEKAKEVIQDPETSILILDEINVALHFNLLKIEDVLSLIEMKPPHMELIMTGRRVPEEIMEKADLITEMREVRHYYNTIKLEARKGIEH